MPTPPYFLGVVSKLITKKKGGLVLQWNLNLIYCQLITQLKTLISPLSPQFTAPKHLICLSLSLSLSLQAKS